MYWPGFIFIVTVGGVSSMSATSNNSMKRIMDEFERTQYILRKMKYKIVQGFDHLRKEQE